MVDALEVQQRCNMAENTTQMKISDLVKQDGISASLIKRIEKADVDQDGTLSVQEIVQLVQCEQQAHADRKLFRNMLIALVVGILILIAALCGTVYAIVKLTQEVGDDNGVLVSTDSGEAISTGQVVDRLDVTQLYLQAAPGLTNQLETLVIPTDNGFTVYRVASVQVDEDRALVSTIDGTKFQVDERGVFREGQEPIPVGNSTTGRRLLEDKELDRKKCSTLNQNCVSLQNECGDGLSSDNCKSAISNACRYLQWKQGCSTLSYKIDEDSPLESCYDSKMDSDSNEDVSEYVACVRDAGSSPARITPTNWPYGSGVVSARSVSTGDDTQACFDKYHTCTSQVSKFCKPNLRSSRRSLDCEPTLTKSCAYILIANGCSRGLEGLSQEVIGKLKSCYDNAPPSGSNHKAFFECVQKNVDSALVLSNARTPR